MVADFGIALALSAAAGGRMTETGLSLGTPHYMSPEQATAEKDISSRSDVYSLASVLYEMLTGDPPHTGSSAQQIIMKIITEPATSVTRFRQSVPANVAAAVATALEKLPADRFESARAFADALANPAYAGRLAVDAVRSAPAGRRRFATVGGAAGLIAVAAVGGYLVGHRAGGADETPVAIFRIPLPDSVTEVSQCCGPGEKLAPDGTLVFVGGSGSHYALYKREPGRLGAELIPGTEGASSPFISPDGAWVGFSAGGRLLKVPLRGGPTVPIAETGKVWGATWGDDDTVTYEQLGQSTDRLMRVAAGGGTPTPSAVPAGLPLFFPDALPGGKQVLASLVDSRAAVGKRATRVVLADLVTGRIDTVAVGLRGEYADGTLVYGTADGTLVAQPFDPATGKVSGQGTAILDSLSIHGAVNPEFTVSASGWLAYERGGLRDHEVLTMLGPEGADTVPLPGPPAEGISGVAVSPNGKRIAMQLTRGSYSDADRDLWILDRAQGTLARFTVGGGRAPVWSRDGRRIAYMAVGDSTTPAGLYIRDVDQAGAPVLALRGKALPGSWLPGDRGLVFAVQVPASHDSYDIGEITLGDSVPRWLVHSDFSETAPRLSPDGHRLAFTSDRTGRQEIYVLTMGGDAAPVQVSADGGTSARWSADGRKVLYLSQTSIVAVTLSSGGPVQVASRRVVENQTLNVDLSAATDWDVFPDGTHFVYSNAGTIHSRGYALIQNWPRLVRSLGGGR
jgi:serine/threonine-protein kinase